MRGLIVASMEEQPSRPAELRLLAPYLAGLTAEEADIVGLMPVGSVNERLLAALPSPEERPRGVLMAGVFLCDPFLRGRRLFERLREGGVTGVVGWPTVHLVPPGVYRQALTAAGIEPGAELAALAEARRAGLEVMATVASHDQAARAVEAGIPSLLFHPGTPTGEAALDARLVEGVMASLDRIRTLAPRPRLALYRHPGFGAGLDPALALVEDVLDWAVPAPRRLAPASLEAV